MAMPFPLIIIINSLCKLLILSLNENFLPDNKNHLARGILVF